MPSPTLTLCTYWVGFAVFPGTFLYLFAHIGIFIEIKIYQMKCVHTVEHMKQTHRNNFFLQTY